MSLRFFVCDSQVVVIKCVAPFQAHYLYAYLSLSHLLHTSVKPSFAFLQ